jgi:hypothetical protein
VLGVERLVNRKPLDDGALLLLEDIYTHVEKDARDAATMCAALRQIISQLA